MPSFSFSSSSSVSYSTSTQSSSGNGTTSGHAYRQESHSTPEGTTVRTTTQNLGERPVVETQTYDSRGRAIEGGNGSAANTGNSSRQIEDVTEEEADKLYRERMEDEYAKREGGA